MSKLLAGRYELIEKIGEGGMAVVYKAKDRLLSRYVAIKILRPEYTKDEQFVESFRRESQAAAGLQHPNIVAVYDVGKSGSINYIVMELIDGTPLSDLIAEKGRLDYKETIDIASQVASALSLAHKHQLIHRDVKPHNIMITKDGIAKLTDFGIAKAVSSSTLVADTNKIIGSVHYFSPEQARGARVDERSDLYSLGIVIYEMLTGKVPFDGDNPVEVALKQINDPIVPPSKLVSGVPPALDRLVVKATQKQPEARYSTADEMLEDLKNIDYITSVVGSAAFIPAGGSYVAASQAAAQSADASSSAAAGAAKTTDTQSAQQNENHRAGGGTPPGKNGEDKKSKKRKIITISCIAAIAVLVILFIIIRAISGSASEEVVVPDLKGLTYDQAEQQLTDLGLKIAKDETTVSSEEIAEGSVVSQMPLADTKVKKGRTITVILSSGNTEIILPDLSGKTYDEAADLLSSMGLEITQGESVESDIEKDLIASQYPASGTQMEKGDTVTVYLSKGVSDGVVPKLVGMEYTSDEDIKAYLERYNYELGDVSYEESYDEPGMIIDQTPAAGETAAKGTQISIVVSKAKTTAEVPNVIGLDPESALKEITAAGFIAGTRTDAESTEQEPGIVFKQYPNAGSELELGSAIDIWVVQEQQTDDTSDSTSSSGTESGSGQ
ncbi:MAG: Stk1 family PASTA domain-containing Ser/Thr kinase [Eubacterium sp.]